MTDEPDIFRRRDDPMRRVNRNPIWKVTDNNGMDHLVYACDELQAKDYVETALKLVVVAVAFERAPDPEPDVSISSPEK